nr:uncharacterized protein LOC107376075 isoform X2 [Nothobranchius furzeri]
MHTPIHSWEIRLQSVEEEEENVEKLCASAEEHLKLYRKHLMKAGVGLQQEDVESPLHRLEQAAGCYASAIRLSFTNARLHFLLALVLEELHHATEIHGLQEKGCAVMQWLELLPCSKKVLGSRPSLGSFCMEFACSPCACMDKEYQQLKEQGQSSNADYVQTLYVWLSKKTGKGSNAVMRDEESYMYRAFTKYLDAWSLNPDSWEFNLHVWRLLLLQGRRERLCSSFRVDWLYALCTLLSDSSQGWLCCSRSRMHLRPRRKRLHNSYIRGWSTLSASAAVRAGWSRSHQILCPSTMLSSCVAFSPSASCN